MSICAGSDADDSVTGGGESGCSGFAGDRVAPSSTFWLSTLAILERNESSTRRASAAVRLFFAPSVWLAHDRSFRRFKRLHLTEESLA